MRASIFGADEELPKAREAYSDETIGRLHSGFAEDGKPKALTEWRVTTGDRDVAAAVGQLFGGQPVETDSTSEFFIDVFTTRSAVPVILSGPDAITMDMKLWINGMLMHHCDGNKFLSGDDVTVGDTCGCPSTYSERKSRAKTFQGPKPSIEIRFRLADDPELGLFKFVTGSWDFAYVLHQVDAALEDAAGEAVADLTLEAVSFVAKNGPMKGKTVSYTKPVLTNIRSYAAAIAE
jgi:hypothetical protein